MSSDAAHCGAKAPAVTKPADGAVAPAFVFDSFLLGAGALAEDSSALKRLSAGSRLGLRPKGPNRVEVLAPEGRPIGLLPAEDAEVVVDLMKGGAAATARVRALVPAFRRPRVQLSIQVNAIAA